MLTNIQGLRFLAALAVCVLHVGFFKNVAHPFDMGGAGVDLFFVISGFIMVVSSQHLFARDGAIGTFLYRRITRIVPLYWIATLTYLSLQLYFHFIRLNPIEPDIYKITIAGLFFYPMDGPKYRPLLDVGWSLNHEMLFYLLFAATIRFRQYVALASVCMMLCALVLLGRTGIVHHTGIQNVWLNGIQLEFVWGIIAGVLYIRCKPRPIVAASILVIGVLIFARSTFAYADREFFLGLPAALVVFGAACLPQIPEDGLFGRAVTLLGDSSYALYLLHLFVFMFKFVNFLPLFVLVVLAVTLSVGVRLLIEVPTLAFFRMRKGLRLAT